MKKQMKKVKDDKPQQDSLGLALDDFVKDNVNVNDTPKTTTQSVEDRYATIKQIDHDALNKVLLETLNPQLAQNEEQKRIFKENLMKYIRRILVAQMILVSIPILMVFVNICLDIPFMKTIEKEQIQTLFSFLKYYIGAIIVEFIAMLFFIVKYVFDKSIVDLTKAMTDNK